MRGARAASVQGQRGDLADEGKGSATGVVVPGAQRYLPKKQGVSRKRGHQEVTMHRPRDWDLLPLQEAFPGCASIWAAPSRARSQHPHPRPGDAGGEAWPWLEHGSREAAANASP